jgi:uncharacterized repeat protein (TIGR01451 family)
MALAMAPSAFAQVCAASGKDGPATISGVVNTYYPGTANAAAGATTINVGTAVGAGVALAPGDLVLIIQMQNGVNVANFTNAVATYTAAASTAGQYEYRLVADFAAGVVTLHNGLTNAYANNQTAGAARQTFQVVRVPQYSSATLAAAATVTPLPWNGTAGGVVAIDVAGVFTLNGTIEASGYGFRGGAGRVYGGGAGNTNASVRFTSDNTNGAMKGEGTAGSPRSTFSSIGNVYSWAGTGGDFYPNGDNGYGAPGNAGGGGNDGNIGDNDQNSGGGGGGGAGAGGVGGNTWATNLAVGGRGGRAMASSATRAYMGGGGGAATSNNGGTNDATFSGASGGGVVLVRAGSFAGNGTVNANGANGQTPVTTCCDDGGTGGGGGGSIVLLQNAAGALGAITANARGGNGSPTPSGTADHGPGGGGGGGAVQTTGALAGTNVTGGAAGAAYGSADGSAGSASSALTFTGGTGALGGASCRPNLTVTKITTTPARTVPAQWSAVYSIRVSNAATAAAAWGVAVSDVLPAPFELIGTTAAAATALASGPGTAPATGTSSIVIGVAGGDLTNSYLIRPGGNITLTFSVDMNNPATGTYQNSATVDFSDPTRTAAGTTVSPGDTYTGGGSVGGSNYASGSSAGENVVVTGSPTVVISAATLCPADSAEATGTNLITNSDFLNTAAPLGQGGGVTLVAVNNDTSSNNEVSYQTGYRSYTSGTPDRAQSPFPGDPARQVDDSDNWVMANGNTLAANAGIWWSQTAAGLTPGQTHTFFIYVSSPIVPGSAQATDPALRLTVTQATPAVITPVNALGNATVTDDTTGDRWVIFQASFLATQTTATIAISNSVVTAAGEHNGYFALARPTLRACTRTSNLQVSKTNSVTSVPAGGTFNYVITVTNGGPQTAAGTTVIDVPSPGLACSTVACSSTQPNMCPAASFPFANLQSGIQIAPAFPVGASATLTVNCSVTATGQ